MVTPYALGRVTLSRFNSLLCLFVLDILVEPYASPCFYIILGVKADVQNGLVVWWF